MAGFVVLPVLAEGGFAPFTVPHAVTVVVCVAAIAGTVLAGRGLGEASRRRFERSLGWATLLAAAVIAAWWLAPSRFAWSRSLPLELCDLAMFVAGASLLSTRRVWQTLGVFWGLGLSTQGLVTPTVTAGPDQAHFWVFWVQHASIVGAAVYHIAARAYRPRWRDYALACAATYVYLLMAMTVNAALGANYGRVGRDQPGHEMTIVQVLGPWPLRVVWIVLLVHAVYALVWWLVRMVPPPRVASAQGPQSPA